jgi:hypothetical protein
MANDSEFCRYEILIAFSLYRAANELFVRVRPVHVGRIEEVDTELECAVDGGDRFVVVAAAVELAHSHAAKPDC